MNQPPKWAKRFLEWYCNPDVLEEIQGDVNELYARRIQSSGKSSADLYFIWNVLRFFRWKNIRKRKPQYKHSPIPLAMLKSYLLSGLRNISRNVIPSSINIFGLSIALGCGLTIFLLIDSYYNRDTFHEKKDRLYLLTDKVKSADEIEKWTPSPYLLGPALKDEHSVIESVVRVQREWINIRSGDIVFNELVWFVDPDFCNAFSYPVLHGRKNALSEKQSIVLTSVMAEKYFGRTDVVGEELSLKFSNGKKLIFNISAVIEIPDNASVFIRFLIPLQHWEEQIIDYPAQWRTWTQATFVVLKESHLPGELDTSLEKYKKIQNDANDKFQIQGFEWIPITEVGKRSYDLVRPLSWSNIPETHIAIGLIGIFLVLLACFNYMNVAVASVSTRLKEIGIRKVIGGGKKEIIQQFLTENIILCAFALAVGTGLCYFFLLPGVNALYPIDIPFKFSSDFIMFGFFGGVLILVALASGAYPALYVSSFNAIKVLKGREKFGSKSLFSKILLSIQFTLSFTTIVGCLVLINSSEHFEKKDWGYNHAQNIFVPIHNIEQYAALRDRVAQNKNVISYAGSETQIGYSDHTTTVNFNEDQVSVSRFEVGFDYLQTMNVLIKKGRYFDPAIASDKTESVIVNEAFVRKMGWKDPLNKSFEWDAQKWYIVGVVEDFHFKEFYFRIEPVIIHIGKEENFKFLVVKAEAGAVNEVADFLKRSWKAIAPDDPYEGSFQDTVFEQFFNSNRSNDKIMYFLSAVALILACSGLYGLISYNLTRRLKEFSVRKVFGASLMQIFRLMNRDYIWIVMISFVVGATLGFYLMEIMIRASYPENIPINAWPFIVTTSLILFTLGLTIFSQLQRVARENPVETLRSE